SDSVDPRPLAGAVQVRVGVTVGRLPVGRPPRVPDPGHPRKGGVRPEHLLEGVQLPGLADDLDLAPAQNLHPGRALPPVLEAPQAGEQDRKRLLTTGIADDPTHAVRLPSCDDRWRGQGPIVAAGQATPARCRPPRPGARRWRWPPPGLRLAP